MSGLVLIVLIILFALPAVVPIIRWRTLPMTLQLSIIAFIVGMALQLLFVCLVATKILTLDYSSRFAAIGLPCSIIAIIMAAAGGVRFRTSLPLIIGCIAAAGMWLFLETLHQRREATRRPDAGRPSY